MLFCNTMYPGSIKILSKGRYVCDQQNLKRNNDFCPIFRRWRTGEPNNGGKNGEDCAVLYKEGNWNDIRCDTRVKFVCEKKEVSVQ